MTLKAKVAAVVTVWSLQSRHNHHQHCSLRQALQMQVAQVDFHPLLWQRKQRFAASLLQAIHDAYVSKLLTQGDSCLAMSVSLC